MSYRDVIKFLFECRKSSYIALNLLIMNIRIKKIFFLKNSSHIHLWFDMMNFGAQYSENGQKLRTGKTYI